MHPGDEPDDELFEMTSGYLQRGKSVMPRSTRTPPLTLEQDYRSDRKWMRASPVDDGIMQISRVVRLAAA